MYSLEKQGIKTQSNNDRIWVAYVNDDMKKIAIGIASTLRSKGISAEVDLTGKPLRKQMDMASNSKYVVLVAPKEHSTNSVIIRDMRDGSEREVNLDAILNDPKSNLQL